MTTGRASVRYTQHTAAGRAGRSPAPPTTREQILEAAFRILVTLGYNQVSVRKIAEEAGVNQSLLHYHYGSKENLMLEVLDYVNERLLARQRAMYAEARSFEQIWAQSLEYFREDVQSGYVRALWELRAQGLSDARIRERLQEIIGGWRDLVASLARQALTEYGIQRKLDPVALGRLMGDVYWGAEAEILAGEDPSLHFEAIRVLGNLFRWLALDEQTRKRREAPGRRA
jgi:AcrR family transcriptional regulator